MAHEQHAPLRDELHRLLDHLPDDEVHAARRYLEFLRNTRDAADGEVASAARGYQPLPATDSARVRERRAGYRPDAASSAEPNARDPVHRLIDELDGNDLLVAKPYLQYLHDMADPVYRRLMEAPYDDEPLTPEDEAAIEEGLADLAAGRVVSHEEVKREFGL